jgi:hypothetical protein
MCNLLIAQCNSWAEPPTVDEYLALKKKQLKKNMKTVVFVVLMLTVTTLSAYALLYVSARTANNSNDGSKGSPVINIQKAIDMASDNTSFDVAEGNYYGTLNRGNINVTKQTLYYQWVCQQGEHAGATIVFARYGDVFRGEYVDPGFQDYFSIPIMGMIDGEGRVTGVSGAMTTDGIHGKISGRIDGDKFHAVWLPTPERWDYSEFREMEMTQQALSPEIQKEIDSHPAAFYNILYPEFLFMAVELETGIAGFIQNRLIPFPAETPYTEVAYGYSIGEQERRHIHIGKGAKNDEVEFYLHLVEGGIQDTDVTIRGFARLDGNRFRYKEKGYEFEVAVYNRFITVKTITGDLDGVKADGVYPTTLEMSYYVNPDAFDNY